MFCIHCQCANIYVTEHKETLLPWSSWGSRSVLCYSLLCFPRGTHAKADIFMSVQHRYNFLALVQSAMKSPAFVSRLGSRSDITSRFRLWAQTPAPWPGLALVVARFLPDQLLGFLCPWDSSMLAVSLGEAEQNDTGSCYATELYSDLQTANERSFVLSFLLWTGCRMQNELWWFFIQSHKNLIDFCGEQQRLLPVILLSNTLFSCAWFCV